MADPDVYVMVTCTECETLILKPHTTPTSTFTAYSYRPAIEMPTVARHAASDTNAVCSQCRRKTVLSAKDRPK